ncbi:hypothetical protein Zmor_010101 [Zophobas morio]|uniref:Uncharacterized protein n=1 Tax=Zophobas morio TaxID=2755281 RepID=A0AA38MJJ1_9CUCU|nr:hypothetical protein Zmor_010101 [Zophobas morio]
MAATAIGNFKAQTVPRYKREFLADCSQKYDLSLILYQNARTIFLTRRYIFPCTNSRNFKVRHTSRNFWQSQRLVGEFKRMQNVVPFGSAEVKVPLFPT